MKKVNVVPNQSMPAQEASDVELELNEGIGKEDEVKKNKVIKADKKVVKEKKSSGQGFNILKWVTIFLLASVVGAGGYFLWQFYNFKGATKKSIPFSQGLSKSKEIPLVKTVLPKSSPKDEVVKVEKDTVSKGNETHKPKGEIVDSKVTEKQKKIAGKKVISPVKGKKENKSSLSVSSIPSSKDGKYHILVATFVFKENAKKFLAELKSKGFHPYEKVKRAQHRMYNIFLGPYNHLKEAEDLNRQLESRGFTSSIKGNVREKKFLVRVGIYFYKDSALEVMNSLRNRGYNPTLVRQPTEVNTHQIRIGNFNTYAEAQQQQRLLEKKSYIKTIIFPKLKT